MQIVSSAEFAAHQDKYFDMAVSHDVCIKREQKLFQLIYKPVVDEQPLLQPDDDLHNAITAEELKARMHVSIRKFFADKQ